MTSSVQYSFLHSNGEIITAPILSGGGVRTIIRDGNTALKLLLKCGPLGSSGNPLKRDAAKLEESYEAMLREKAVYRRISYHDAIVSCIES